MTELQELSLGLGITFTIPAIILLATFFLVCPIEILFGAGFGLGVIGGFGFLAYISDRQHIF